MSDDLQVSGKKKVRLEWMTGYLGALVAVYSILTALTAFNAAEAGGNSTKNFFSGIQLFIDANFFAAEASSQYNQDFHLIENYYINVQLGED